MRHTDLVVSVLPACHSWGHSTPTDDQFYAQGYSQPVSEENLPARKMYPLHIFLGSPVLLDRTYCPPQDQNSTCQNKTRYNFYTTQHCHGLTDLTFTMSTNLASLVNGWEWQNCTVFHLYSYALQILHVLTCKLLNVSVCFFKIERPCAIMWPLINYVFK